MLQQRQLECFVQVARHLHFGKAALALSVSQPALSQTIRKLEAQLGFDLLARSTRDVRLTAAGEVFLEEATATLAQMQRMVDRARRVADGGSGTLTVGYVAYVRQTASLLIAEFSRVKPGTLISHRQEYTPQVLSDLHSGSMDVASILEQDVPEEFESIPLRDLPLIAVVHDTHPLAKRKTVSLAEVSRFTIPFASIPGTDHWPTILAKTFTNRNLTPNLFPVRTPVGEQLISDARASNGFVVLQTCEFDSGWGVQIPISPRVTWRFSLVHRARIPTPELLQFLDAAVARRDREGWLDQPSSLDDEVAADVRVEK